MPRVAVSFAPVERGPFAWVESLPDTGAAVTCVHTDLAERLNLHLGPTSVKLVGANKLPISMRGEGFLIARWHTLLAAESSLRTTFLLRHFFSASDQKSL